MPGYVYVCIDAVLSGALPYKNPNLHTLAC